MERELRAERGAGEPEYPPLPPPRLIREVSPYRGRVCEVRAPQPPRSRGW